MSEDRQWKPAPIQIVSDLGQLTAFGDPDQSRILRILQRQEATAEQLGKIVDLPASLVGGHVQRLMDLALVRLVSQREVEGREDDVYRAAALMFNLKPEPRDMKEISNSLAESMLGTLSQEVFASLDNWPDQKMNFEWRRTHLPLNRVLEFNDRLVELMREFWGDAEQPAREDPTDPLMAFIGVWYRLPE